ncbi:Tyrosine recombinase XerC [subsurface metagenome]
MLTKQAIQEFLLSRGGLRPKTLRDYRMHLAHFQRCFPDLPTTPQPLQSYLNSFTIKSKANPQGVEPETVHARFRTIRALYNQIQLWHPKIPNPMKLVRPPELRKKTMRIFADSELYSLFSLPLSPRDRALSTLLLDVGPRADECTNLVWDYVLPGYVVLKGKTGSRTVPISETTYRQLQALRNGGGIEQHVFLGERGPLSYQGIYKLVRHLCHQAGIDGKRCSPHTWRHTFASNYAAAEGCDPSVLPEIMGHKDFKTTLRYIQNNPIRMARNHQRCTPLKILGGAAQGFLFSQDLDTSQAIKEAEAIVMKEA